MTMVICKECKGHISTLAQSCLHCGATRKAPVYAIALGAFVGMTLLCNTWLLWRLYEVEAEPVAIATVPTQPDS